MSHSVRGPERGSGIDGKAIGAWDAPEITRAVRTEMELTWKAP